MFTPYAWAKLLYLRDRGPTEVGGFGISARDQPALIDDVRLVRQRCTAASVVLDDGAVADLFDELADEGRVPGQFGRVWIHTHPGRSAQPSSVDEETFERIFRDADWGVMAIVSRGGKTSARLRFTAGPGASLQIRTRVEFGRPFPASDERDWDAQYAASVVDVRSELMAPVLGLREADLGFNPAWNHDAAESDW
jgi:proteasome lid subunit RPN8/RPN11